ncbi:hypothetical protein D9619_008521 [Psilocybe cf. subviscida]|uniref:Methyltransferase domain-containing protein n=1 Tax=Psilocybe cf. subviscida TaxID=2480587 RepID=A0A8H5B9U3_9AGAR|nr:hypothetical protein D9619_008521 [Psilocybe cf. subviscida]
MALVDFTPKKTIEHTPRWHTSKTYILHSDQAEAQRLKAQHAMLRDVYEGRIVLAPVTVVEKSEVLDVGTGSGAWAVEFLSTYPNALKVKVLCIDIGTRLFPQYPPANATFEVGNILDIPQEWNNRFSLVHQRLLVGALKSNEWEQAIQNIFRITAPSGWIQLTEAYIDKNIFSGGPASLKGMAIYDILAKTVGLDIFCTWRLEKILKEAGFTDIQAIRVTVPIGAWNGELSGRVARNMTNFFRGLKTPVLCNGGFGIVDNESEFDKLMDAMDEEWKKPGTSIDWHSYIGRKAV